jgi:uncharacterized membrane protein
MLDDYQPKPRMLWIAAILFFVVIVAVSWFRWATFQYETFDLAFYVQSFWLACHGQWHVSLLDVPLMGNHAEPICFLMLPFFWIWQHPMFFVVVQALMLATMPFTAYRIARRLEFERTGALCMALATLLAPATGFIALHEFHPEALSAPFILLMIEARQAKRPGSFWLCFLLAVMCKENVALMLGWFCAVHWLLERENGREWQMTFNVLPCAVALGWVAAYALWLSPKLNGGKVDYLEIYSHLGSSGGDIAGKFFTEPSRALGALWRGLTGGNLVWELMVSFVLLPLLRPRWLIIAAPLFAQHLLSSRSSEWDLKFHYAAPMLPLLWMAAAEAAANLFWRDIVARWVAGACLMIQLISVLGPFVFPRVEEKSWSALAPARMVVRVLSHAPEALDARVVKKEMLALIPENARAMAGLPYLSHLAKREQLHSLHFTLKGLRTLSRADYTPPPVDAVLVDVSDGATFDAAAGYYHPTMFATDGRVFPDSDLALHRYLRSTQWTVYAKNSITTYLRGVAPGPKPVTGSGSKLDDFQTLAGLKLQTEPPPARGTQCLIFTWDLGKDRPMIPWMQLRLKGADGREWTLDKGPIALGLEGGSFQELWTVWPDLPPGKYRGRLLIYDKHEKARQKKLFENRLIEINGEIEL